MRQPALTPDSALPLAALRPEAANDGVFRWKLLSGFASVVAVAAIGWNVWGFASAPRYQQLAQQPLAQLARSETVQPALPGAQRMAVSADGDAAQMLRDPQLDNLLAAHRGMAAFGASPSAFLRNATFEEPPR
jgi:sigma-E factor negative regulatory protein RseA